MRSCDILANKCKMVHNTTHKCKRPKNKCKKTVPPFRRTHQEPDRKERRIYSAISRLVSRLSTGLSESKETTKHGMSDCKPNTGMMLAGRMKKRGGVFTRRTDRRRRPAFFNCNSLSIRVVCLMQALVFRSFVAIQKPNRTPAKFGAPSILFCGEASHSRV